jgi:hypothetical protein
VGPAQSIALPDSATLTAFVKDDDLPAPKPRAPRRQPSAAWSGAAAPTDTAAVDAGGDTANAPAAPRVSQLRVNWVLYRGPVGAAVTFAPDESPVTDGKAAVMVHPSK